MQKNAKYKKNTFVKCEMWGSKKLRNKKQTCIFRKIKFKTILSKMLVLDDILF